MNWYAYDTWIVIIGALCAIAAALPGTFLVLRRMSMMGDAISHAVLPGLAVAFLVTGTRASLAMFAGAAIVGVLTAVFTQWISSWGKVDRGASMGIVFTTLFAFGLLLIVQAADHVDLDPGCVLYGAIELTPLDVLADIEVGGILLEIPRAAVVLGAVAVVNLLLIVSLYKEYKISAFDPDLATTQGVNAGLMHYLLMTQVAVTTVASFEAVGSIIVIAMLIVPAATAHLLTDRLGLMLVLATGFGALSSFVGHVLALWLPPLMGFAGTTTSGMMAVATGLFFLLAWLFSPRYGVVRRIGRQRLDVAELPEEERLA
ncbi:metal ABC transporter permease [Ruficoccus amylovorans]|uniref:Metal ABC transporter permease n=1 Tax=Ruficoccus amylovorans TaxID=1804625 RepID=A0A842HCA7_9BACT|nr:metal ABC transporter permease [Ruficoccus amylovorans]MBC2593237.1 metal ABC transporter permease [Ruficoccus amylovorans]